MLWVLIRGASARHYYLAEALLMSTHNLSASHAMMRKLSSLTFYFKSLGIRLVSAAHIIKMSSACLTSARGMVCFRIWKFFIRSIALSTWILARESLLEFSTSFCGSCFFPFVKAGMAKEAPRTANSSWIKKPRSASTKSSYSNLS